MRWFKLAAIGAGILIAFLVVGSVIGFIIHAVTYLVLAALVVGAIAVAIKVASSRRQVSGKKAEREVREPDDRQYNRPLPRADVEPVSTPYPPPSRPRRPGRGRRTGPAQARDGRLAAPLSSGASSPRRAWSPPPGSRPCGPAPRSVRPITHMVSSAGLPTTVTAGVAFFAVMR